jgi:small subunit ribosomal protein S17
MTTATRGNRKTRVGTVISDKMDKTIVVLVERNVIHPQYKKVVKINTKFQAHDLNNDAKIGDTVEIMETRPLSKLKRWRLCRIVKKGN